MRWVTGSALSFGLGWSVGLILGTDPVDAGLVFGLLFSPMVGVWAGEVE